MNSLAINPNRRTNPILGDTTPIQPETIQRIVSIVLPFISLHAKGQLAVSLGMGSFQTYVHGAQAKKHIHSKEWRQAARETGHLAVVVSSVALSILFPIGQFALSQAWVVATRSIGFVSHVSQRQWHEAAKDIAALAHCAIHVASVWYGTSGWLALSLGTQAGLEFIQAWTNRDKLPEAVANTLLGLFRLHSTAPHLRTLHRNHYGKKLTQVEWNQMALQGVMKLDELFAKKGISSYVDGIDFSQAQFANAEFQNLRFTDCNFSRTLFSNTKVLRTDFGSCLFKESKWIESVVQDCFFRNCNFTDAAVLRSRLQRVSILESNLSLSCWNESLFENVTLIKDQLTETSFLHATAKNSSIVDSDLTDCLLLDAGFNQIRCTANVYTRPVIGLAWNFEFHGIFTPIIHSALKDSKAIVLRFEIPGKNAEKVDQEAMQAIRSIQKNPSPTMLSIPEEMLQRAEPDSEIGKMKARAVSILRHCHGLAIPGGSDVEPEFYGAKREAITQTEPHFVRSMTEFALLSAARSQGTPVMGTCRGSQLINVFFGGTLKQDVHGHMGAYQQLQLQNPHLSHLFGKELIGLSMHHQASDQIGQGLEVVFGFEGTPKILVSQDRQFLASQVHPEAYLEFNMALKKIEKLYPFLSEEKQEFCRKFFAMAGSLRANKAIYAYFLERVRHFWKMKHHE